jgi:hypothetical protein
MWDMKNKVCNSFGNFWYDGDTCPDCSVEISLDNASYSAGTNGPTSGKSWGSPKRVKYCEEDWLKRRKKMPSRVTKKEKAHLLNTAPAEEVLAFLNSTRKETRKQPKFNQGKYKSPLARAVEKGKIKSNPEFSREGPGVVYVYEDEMKIPGVLKIGSTQYSKGRLPSANTWGAFNCLYERHFERRYEAEDIVHTMLDDCRIWRDKEWFKVSLELAIKTIEEVELDDTKEQAMG